MKPSQNVETKYVRLIYKYLWNRSFQHLHRSSFVLFLSRKQLRRVRYSGYLAVNVLGHVHRAFCFTDRNGQQKLDCESLKRMWRNFAHLTRPPYQSIAWRPTGMRCSRVMRHKWITCILSTGPVQALVSLRTYKSAQMVEVLLLNRVLRSIVSDSKGLTAGKWVLSRGSLHSSSCCFMNFLSLHGFTCSTRPWKELWRRFLSPAKKNRLWTWSETLRCVNF